MFLQSFLKINVLSDVTHRYVKGLSIFKIDVPPFYFQFFSFLRNLILALTVEVECTYLRFYCVGLMRVLRLVFIEFLQHISQLVCTISLSVFPSEIIANSSAYRKWLMISIISRSSVYTLKSICVNHFSFYISQSAFFDLVVLHFNLLLWFLMQCHLLLVFLNILFNQILRLIVPYVADKYTNTALFFFYCFKVIFNVLR